MAPVAFALAALVVPSRVCRADLLAGGEPRRSYGTVVNRIALGSSGALLRRAELPAAAIEADVSLGTTKTP